MPKGKKVVKKKNLPIKTVQEIIKQNNADLDAVPQDSLDIPEMQGVVNEAVTIIRKAFRSSKVPAKEKRDKALAIMNKVMAGQLNVKHDVGDNFLNLVKEMHKR